MVYNGSARETFSVIFENSSDLKVTDADTYPGTHVFVNLLNLRDPEKLTARAKAMVRKIEELEQDIKQLSPEQLRQFRAWYEEFDSEAWDEQIEHDDRNGKLDDLANQAIKDHQAGKTKKY